MDAQFVAKEQMAVLQSSRNRFLAARATLLSTGAQETRPECCTGPHKYFRSTIAVTWMCSRSQNPDCVLQLRFSDAEQGTVAALDLPPRPRQLAPFARLPRKAAQCSTAVSVL